MAIWMRWGALLGVVACAAAPRGVAPVRHVARPAESAAPRPTPPFPEYQLRAAARDEYVFEGRADRLLLGDTRITLQGGAIAELSPTTSPSMQDGSEVPTAAGGGFVFWDSSNLYRTRSFVGALEPFMAAEFEVSRVALGPGYWLVLSNDGHRLAIDPKTGDPRAPTPSGVVDVAMDDAGRVVAALELGRAVLSLDGGKTYRQVERELGGDVTELWREPLGFLVDDQTLVSVAADGSLQRSPAAPRMRRPTEPRRGESPIEPSWPALERAFGSGIAAGPAEALIVDRSSVSRIDLASGKVVLSGPQLLPAPARCRLFGDGHEALAACQALTTLHVFSSPLQSPPRLEKRFTGEARVWEGFGRVVVDRDCDGSARPWSVCQRGTDGTWRGLTSQHAPSAEQPEVLRYVPKADGGVVALFKPNSAFDLASGKQVSLDQNGFARAASSDACVVDTNERLRCLTRAGIVVIEPDGKLGEQPRFDDAFGSGERALAILEDHFFQTTDYGETWTEVRSPPAFGHAGSRGSTCSPLGCVFGAWIRRGWDIHPPRVPMRQVLPFSLSRPTPELRELSCRARAAAAAKAVFERAEREKVAWGARLVSQSLLLKGLRIPAAPQAAAASGDDDQRGELAIIQAEAPRQARAEFRYLDFLDPSGRRRAAPLPYAGLERERELLGIGSPFEIPGDENSLTAVPVLAADASADGFVLVEQAVTLWIHGARVEVVPLGGEYEDWSVDSALSTKDGLVVLVTRSSDGRGRALRVANGALSELFEVPATPLRARHPTADALGISEQGELVVLRFPSGDDPPSAEDPVLAYAPGKPLRALAPFSAARTADDGTCKAAAGYRALVMPPRRWLQARSTSTWQPKDWGMIFSARWSENHVCIEALELPAEPTQHESREFGTNVVARFGASNAAVRRGMARGWELEQQLSCELSPP